MTRAKRIPLSEMLKDFGVWLKHAPLKLLRRRGVQSHSLAFVLGALVCAVLFRAIGAAEPVSTEAEIRTVAVEATATPEPTAQVDYDAACVARVLYGVRDYNLSDTAKKAVIEVIKNRVECTYGEFGDTVSEVCNKAQQWQGYVEGGDYLEADYELALSCLYDTSGARTIPEGCYFLIVKTGEVIARTEWDGGNEWSVQ